MFVLCVRDILNKPLKSLKSFELKRITNPNQIIGLNLFKIIHLEKEDSSELLQVVRTRIRARIGSENSISTWTGHFLPMCKEELK